MDKKEGEVSRFFFEVFLSHSAEKIRRGTLQGVTDFGYRKILCLGGLCHDFSSNFFVSQYQKTLQGNPSVLCFGKFLEAKKFMDKKEGEVSRFFFEVFLSHSAEKIRRGTLQGVTDFGYRKILCLGGLCHDFLSNFFVSQYQKTLQGNPSVLCFGKFLVAKKFMDKREGEVSGFSIESFLSHSAEKICRGTLQGVTDFGYRKVLCLGGLCHDFSSNFFVSQYRKTLQRNPSVLYFGKFLEAKKFMDKKEGEVSRFFFEVFLSHSAEKIRRGTLQGVTDFGYRKMLCLGGLCHDFSSNFLVSQYQKTLQGNPSVLCFGKFLEAKKFMDKKEGEVSRFFFEVFLSHSAEKIRRGTLQGVTDFGYRKILCLGGLCHDFSSNFFVSQYQKTLQGNPSVLCFGKFLEAKKFMDKKEGEVSRFFFEVFLSHSAEKIRRGTLQGVTDFGYRKILCLGGLCHDFSSNFFVSQYQKTLQGNPSVLCFGKFLEAKKLMDKKEGEVSRFFFEVFLSHSAEKIRRGTLQGVTDFGYRKILCLGGLCHDFSSNFFVSQYQKTLQGNPSVLCFGKFLEAKKFMDKKEGEVSRFFFEVFLSHSAEKICRETLQCVTDFGIEKFYA